MEYLAQFQRELTSGQVVIHDKYVDQTNTRNHEKKNDVVTELSDNNKWVAVACLPIARQIVVFERKICIMIPKLGDLFVGLLHHPVIEKVTFIINNYSEEIAVEGRLRQISSGSKDPLLLWQFTELPVILLTIQDYEHVNIQLQIELNNQYSLHASNQEVFKACYGYFHKSYTSAVSQTVYQIPLLNPQYQLDIICGIWTITSHGTVVGTVGTVGQALPSSILYAKQEIISV